MSVIALFVAPGGTSFAVAALSKKEKRIVKRIANKQITKRAPGLSVKRAGSAGTATDAGHASSADSATHANNADHATTASHAGTADTATSASVVACEAPVAGAGEMVKAGAVCIDKYEASVWSSPTGGTQYGISGDDYPCSDTGEDCSNVYARSVPGVPPSRFISWFQAQQALANSGKRLPTNAEWQQAVAGTPGGAPCNVASTGPVNTGSAGGCVSRFGAFDMVGNLWEWVAEWDEIASGCELHLTDRACLGGAGTNHSPAALIRGGVFNSGGDAGSMAIAATNQPHNSGPEVGFRGAR
jgi:hypothetical protein